MVGTANTKRPAGEMSENNLLAICKIFWPNHTWENQKRFYYDPSNKRKYYQVDCCSISRKLVWEYEGPDHYEDVWKLRRDEERSQYFLESSYTFLRWPYYLQLTNDVAHHFFGNSYSNKKYRRAIEAVYRVSNSRQILAPGFHTTKRTPANYVSRGVSRFLSELDQLPSSVKSQVAETLRRYVRDIDDRYLVIGDTPELLKLLDVPCDVNKLDIFFARPRT